MKTISLSKSQLDIADWAVGAMDDIASIPEDSEELWGRVYDSSPVRIESEVLTMDDNPMVADDLLDRIENQYIQMADSESREEYRKALPVVLALSNKIRQAYGMPLIERADLTINY